MSKHILLFRPVFHAYCFTQSTQLFTWFPKEQYYLHMMLLPQMLVFTVLPFVGLEFFLECKQRNCNRLKKNTSLLTSYWSKIGIAKRNETPEQYHRDDDV